MIKYRGDIDGLRAIAVVSVIIFHLNNDFLPGGFLGVDIFFVISGFLITKIIYTDMNNKSFKYSEFYIKRIKRILPALFFTLTLTGLASYIILLPYDFYKLSISLISIIFFSSNIQYSLRTGTYFSGDSSEWPLLHTWSLATEEQYYFLIPIILFLLLRYKFSNTKILIIFILISIFSFITAQILSSNPNFKSFSYYSIITRMGELMIGSIIAITQVNNTIKKLNSDAIYLFSLILIIASLFFINKNMTFPGFAALLVCLPVALILHSENIKATNILSFNSIKFVGLISYSLYLVHWPVLSLYRYIKNVSPETYVFSNEETILLTVVIILISLVSYYFIEKPLRKPFSSNKVVFLYYFITPSVLVILLASIIFHNKGLPSRFNVDGDEYLQLTHIDKTKCPSLINLGCIGGNSKADEKIILFGNSHAEHYFEYFSLLGEKYNKTIELYGAGGCSFVRKSTKCDELLNRFKEAAFNADTFVIAFRWDHLYEDEKFIAKLKEITNFVKSFDKRIIMVSQPPYLYSNPSKLFNCDRLSISCASNITFKESYIKYNRAIEKFAIENGLDFHDPFENVSNPFIIKYNDRTLYSDFDHLSVFGSRWLFEQYELNNEKSIF